MPSSVSCWIRGTRPTVETVTPRADMPRPSGVGSVSRRTDPDHGLVVGHRLAHAHEDDVRDPAGTARDLTAGERARPRDHLLDDLGCAHVALQTALPRRAERAGHPAPCLGRHAHRHASGVAHEHGLDESSVVEPPQCLAGGALVGLQRVDRGHQVGQQRVRERRPEVGGEVRHVGRVVDEPREVVVRDLLGAVARADQRRRRPAGAPQG